ncbi:MAG: T9SS type A sorting domain-containing protein [Bacteroidetes bacterium]|nr:T9SS type A sorting domain-containing protein [Bacteroidota bacterium]
MIYSNTYENYQLGALQIARDEKIYVPLFQENYAHYEYSFANQNISVINNPSNEGLSCNFDTLTIPLGDARCTATLPNMPNYNLGPLAGSECDTLQIEVNNILPNETFLIYPNPASDNIYFKFSDNNLSLANINSITITDITGHLVKYITQIQNNGIYIGDLVSGMYFVNITWHNNQSTIEKLFIEN